MKSLARTRSKLRRFAGLSLAVVVLVVAVSFLTGWYRREGMLDGIWVEVHGVIIEIFIFTLLLNWYSEKASEVRLKGVRDPIHARAHDLAYSCLSDLTPTFTLSEKLYLDFGGKFAISRPYWGTKVQFEPEESLVLMAEAGVMSVADQWSRYVDTVADSGQKLRSLRVEAGAAIEPAMTRLLMDAEDACEEAERRLASFDETGDVSSDVSKLRETTNIAIRAVGALLQELVERADRIETREEYWERVK